MENNMQTPPALINVVVYTAAMLVSVFVGTLAVMQFLKVSPNEQVFEAFKMAGTSAMSFFFGLLVSTRTNSEPPAPPAVTP